MYGTVARLRAKPGAGERLIAFGQGERQSPDQIAAYLYRLDNDPDTYYLAVVFDNEDADRRHAASPGAHANYLQLRQLLDGEPEWHDGTIVHVIMRPWCAVV